ncbi:MAG: hypothetical protein ACTHU0_21695 [Kofleriaceae bacterium]
METTVEQRWRDRVGVYRSVREFFDPRAYEADEILDDTPAKAFVNAHHYSGTYPAAMRRFGLFERYSRRLVGVAVFSYPVNDAVFSWLPGEKDQSLELGRLVLLDEVLANAETWFIARCFDVLVSHGVTGVVSFADPEKRVDADGRVVMPGHIKTTYQAKGAVYAGRGTPRTLRLLPDGTVLNDRAKQKIRGRERGHEHVEERLIRSGRAQGIAIPELRATASREEARRWLATWAPLLTRRQRHPGNHRYLFGLTKEARRRIPQMLDGCGVPRLPYPKFTYAGVVFR